jgi:hypothetical protein
MIENWTAPRRFFSLLKDTCALDDIPNLASAIERHIYLGVRKDKKKENN